MGRGRILNNYFHRLEPYDRPDILDSEYHNRDYMTRNTAEMDFLYEGSTAQPKPVVKVSGPIPTYTGIEETVPITETAIGEPVVIYEDGIPQILEDRKITTILPDEDTVFTTEYNTGVNEKTKDKIDVPPTSPARPYRLTPFAARKGVRLKPYEKKVKRRFNHEYDEKGNPIQQEKPVYDTVDYLADLNLHRGNFNFNEPGQRATYDIAEVFEDFLVKGRMREGFEVIPSDD